MPGIFLQDPTINQSFDVSFSYRYSEEYEKGMRKWVDLDPFKYKIPGKYIQERIYPFHLPITFLYKIKKYFPPIMALGYFTAVVDIMKMLKFFRRVKPDILHLNNGGYPGALSCNLAAIVGRLAGIPKITYFICSTTHNPWWLKPMTWMVKRAVTTFISASKHLRDHSKFLWKDKTNPGWNIISNTIKSQVLASRESVRQELGIPDDEVVFLCMGDLVERKGFYRAIDSLAQVSDIGVPRSLLIVGEGSEEQLLRDRAKNKKKGVYRIISDLAPSIHPYSIINVCDVLVVPSVGEEDWPNIMLIAMMYGKPIIASNILGFHEMVEHDYNGYLANTEQGFSSMMTLLLDRDLRVAIGQRAQARYEQKYRIDKIMGKYLELWNG